MTSAFRSRRVTTSPRGRAAQGLQTLFANDDWFTDEDSNVYSLPTFVGNHDMGRFGYFLNVDNPGWMMSASWRAAKLANAMMYFARGVPVTYYGDEQGFTGDGGDKDARQDMFPSQAGSYNDDDLIGTGSTTADDNFEPSHPLYEALASMHRSMRPSQQGAPVRRPDSSLTANGPGIYAFARIDRVGQGRVRCGVQQQRQRTERRHSHLLWQRRAVRPGLLGRWQCLDQPDHRRRRLRWRQRSAHGLCDLQGGAAHPR